MSAELQTKSIFAEISPRDGNRICIMTRLTKNDGTTPDERLISGITFNEWRKELAPPDKLVGDWYKRRKKLNLTWEGFTERYLDYLQNPIQRIAVIKLIEESLDHNVTIMCVEDDWHECHRGILAKYCQNLEPNLILTLN